MKSKSIILGIVLLALVVSGVACQQTELADQVILSDWSGYLALHENEITLISVPWYVFTEEDIAIGDYELKLKGLPEGCRLDRILITPASEVFEAKEHMIDIFIKGTDIFDNVSAELILDIQNKNEGTHREVSLGNWAFSVVPLQNHIQIKDFIGKSQGIDIVTQYTVVVENITGDDVILGDIDFELPGLTVNEVFYDYGGTLEINQWKARDEIELVIPPKGKVAVFYDLDFSSDGTSVCLKPIIEYKVKGIQYKYAGPLYENSISFSKTSLNEYRKLP